jgi:hypothetical protein
VTLKVILDSNFLLIPSQFQIDIFEGLMNLLNQRFEPILLSPTYNELRTIAEKSSPNLRKQASFALKLAEKYNIVYVKQKINEAHDDLILRIAEKWRCPVATNDRELRKKLRNHKILVIYLRGKSRLEMEGSL